MNSESRDKLYHIMDLSLQDGIREQVPSARGRDRHLRRRLSLQDLRCVHSNTESFTLYNTIQGIKRRMSSGPEVPVADAEPEVNLNNFDYGS